MTDKRYLGNIITQNPTAPAGNFGNSAAKGVWSLEEQLAYQKAGLWPVPGKFLNVEDVFSTYLYEGNGSTQTITNGIDGSEGALVWIKNRDNAFDHILFDTEQNTNIETNNSNAGLTSHDTTITSTGFSLNNGDGRYNVGSQDYTSWTFRKAPKFFDVVTYTGDGNEPSAWINHSLGQVPGLIIIKRTDNASNWFVHHRSLGRYENILLNSTASKVTQYVFDNTTNGITSTQFRIHFGGGNDANISGASYVAYLFAHNNNDGTFGPDGDADAIKCGSYTGNGSTTGPVVDLGFEPQWVMIKRTDTGGAGYNWFIFDAMRGMPVGGADQYLSANLADAEAGSSERFKITPTGFQLASTSGSFNSNGGTYIYIAIRRGTAVPTSATDVFKVDQGDTTSTPAFNSGFVTDFNFYRNVSSASDFFTSSRLTGNKYLATNSTASESNSSSFTWDFMDGFREGTLGTTFYSWMWKRAPKYMDVVAYTGNGVAGRTVSHNLGVAPEMIWYKNRSDTINWIVYHKDIGTDSTTQVLELDTSDALRTSTAFFNSTAPSASVLTLGTASHTNYNTNTYIAYLFATLAGISKVGSVTHSGTTNVDCGFSSGSRFILLKRTDATGDWYVWDSARGIVSGNDPYLLLNTTGAEVTNTDYIDPLSSGFTITSSFTAGDYIFYAIA